MYTSEEAEGKRLKHPFDTITEGMGINRMTRNFAQAKIDGAFKATDAEAVEMVSVGHCRLDVENAALPLPTMFAPIVEETWATSSDMFNAALGLLAGTVPAAERRPVCG